MSKDDVIIIDMLERRAEVKHPVNGVDCEQKQGEGYSVTCDKCFDKRICLWED